MPMKKEKPCGVLEARDMLDLMESQAPREKAFLAGLWLTGARTNELCRMERRDVFEERGVWRYRIHLSKLKKPEDNLVSFVLWDEDDRRIFEVFRDWVVSRPEGRLFDYKPSYHTNRWTRKKDGKAMEKRIEVFNEPYRIMVFKGRMSANIGGKFRTIPLHYIRSFVITKSLNQAPDDPMLTTLRIGHKEAKTTFGYWRRTGGELDNKLRKLAASRGGAAVTVSSPPPEASQEKPPVQEEAPAEQPKGDSQ